MNESEQNYVIDFRTGYPTAIYNDSVNDNIRAACSSINSTRARGIKEAARHTPAWEQISVDAWTASFKRLTEQWGVPLVSLSKLGIECDRDGILSSDSLAKLPTGAEAEPYQDVEEKVVYKLFYLMIDGSLGKKMSFERNSEGELDLISKNATLSDTLDKIIVLNDVGAHPTEIIGLSDDGCYLVAKQPLAYPLNSFESDRESSLHTIHAVKPLGGNYRTTIATVWVQDQAWVVSDLHKRNIMIDSNGEPTIIDALIGAIPPFAINACYFLSLSIEGTKRWKETGEKPLVTDFEDVPDEDL